MSLAALIVFVAVSAGLLAFSWPSLKRPRSHGFPRFFAFEVLLLLILLNAPRWFDDPWSARQIVSWILLCGALALVIHGFVVLAEAGKPQGSFEETTVLVSTGAYGWIRHPLYASLIGLDWGTLLKGVTAVRLGLAAAATLLLVLTAKSEERENLAKFGDEYRSYMERTRRFVPLVF